MESEEKQMPSHKPKTGSGGNPLPSPTDVTKATSGTRPKRTVDEQQLLANLVRVRGSKPLTVQQENLAIDQARSLGDL
jgi:hypothetical protein